MTQQAANARSGRQEMHDGEDFVCPNCHCEITLKHHGDESKMRQMVPFTCCCGTPMQPEHLTVAR